MGDLDGAPEAEAAFARKGAHRYFQRLADLASQAGAVVDVVAASLTAVNVPLLALLTHQSGGVLLLNEQFGALLGSNVGAHDLRCLPCLPLCY